MTERVWGILVDSFGKILLPGLTMTIPLTVIAFSFAMIIAVITALIQFARVPVLSQIARFYIWVVRGTPLLVQLFVVFFGLPYWGIIIDAFPAAVIIFSINEGAYCAETMRAALESDGWTVHTIWECELKKKRVQATVDELFPQLAAELGKELRQPEA